MYLSENHSDYIKRSTFLPEMCHFHEVKGHMMTWSPLCLVTGMMPGTKGCSCCRNEWKILPSTCSSWNINSWVSQLLKVNKLFKLPLSLMVYLDIIKTWEERGVELLRIPTHLFSFLILRGIISWRLFIINNGEQVLKDSNLNGVNDIFY